MANPRRASHRRNRSSQSIAAVVFLLLLAWPLWALGAPAATSRLDEHIVYVPIPVDVGRDEVARPERVLKERLHNLAKRHLAAAPRRGPEPGERLDRIVVFVDHAGLPILPDQEAARTRATGARDLATPTLAAANELTFTFDSPQYPWTAEELATLSSALSDFYPTAKVIYGNPAFNITVNVRKDPTITFVGLYFLSLNEMVLRDPVSLDVLCHEMIHAFRDDDIILLGHEEGMTRAAEVEVFNRLAAYVHPFDENHSYTYDVYYEGLNRSVIGAQNSNFFNGYASPFLRYQLGGYAWGKILIENPAFFANFNQALYARVLSDPGATTNESTLVEIAASVQPEIEGAAFSQWYGQQGILNTNPPKGYLLYQRINQFTVDFFYRDTSGSEVMQPDAPITWAVYDHRGTLVDAGAATTNQLGVAFLSPTLPAGYTGRINVVVSASTPTGIISDTALRSAGNESGVFGMVTGADSGSLTITSLDALIDPVSLIVSNGAFSGPSLAAVRGRFLAEFINTAGRGVSKYFTKDASDYFLVVITPTETDSDGDGVPDAADLCPDTSPGDVLNADGCNIDQLCPCAGPLSGGTWKKHAAYVHCVKETAAQFVKDGLITGKQRRAIVKTAHDSACAAKE